MKPLALTVLVAFSPLIGCGESTGGTDDSGTNTDSDDDIDSDTGNNTDTGIGCEAAGNWYHASTGLCWQNPPEGNNLLWMDALSYCEELVLGGHSDWHLPTISELRSLIRYCPATETAGSCGVTDSCLLEGCWNDTCFGCPLAGRDQDDPDCYWDPALDGSCIWYWSSSPYGSASAWSIGFQYGFIHHYPIGQALKDYFQKTRCVRLGQ
jgi:hypothetical protein